MTIQPGDNIPDIKLKRLGTGGMEEISTAELLKGRKVVIFGVPGAFTPSCSMKHLPGYISQADAIKAKGVDTIICVAVNDPFVMKHWGEVSGADGKVELLPDGNGDFTRALGLGLDGTGHGLGFRAKRFMMVVNDGRVETLEVEEKASDVELTGAQSCVAHLG